MNETPKDLKARLEREKFAEFGRAAGIAVRPGTIESRDPPEPDILCEIEGRGLVAFELVELVDQDFARRTARLAEFDKALRAYPSQMPEPERDELLRKYANAAVGVTPRFLPRARLLGLFSRTRRLTCCFLRMFGKQNSPSRCAICSTSPIGSGYGL